MSKNYAILFFVQKKNKNKATTTRETTTQLAFMQTILVQSHEERLYTRVFRNSKKKLPTIVGKIFLFIIIINLSHSTGNIHELCKLLFETAIFQSYQCFSGCKSIKNQLMAVLLHFFFLF